MFKSEEYFYWWKGTAVNFFIIISRALYMQAQIMLIITATMKCVLWTHRNIVCVFIIISMLVVVESIGNRGGSRLKWSVVLVDVYNAFHTVGI